MVSDLQKSGGTHLCRQNYIPPTSLGDKKAGNTMEAPWLTHPKKFKRAWFVRHAEGWPSPTLCLLDDGEINCIVMLM